MIEVVLFGAQALVGSLFIFWRNKMKEIIGFIRKILMFVLLFFENAIGILFIIHLISSVKDFAWTEIFSLYVAYAVVSFIGYCLGRIIGLAKKIRFKSMLKGLLIAPLFYYYLIFQQIRPSRPTVTQTNVDNRPEKTKKMEKQQNVSSSQPTDTRKNDIGNVELQRRLNRIEYNSYRADQRYNTVKVTVKERLKLTVGFGGTIRILKCGQLEFTIDAYEDGEIYEPGEVSFKNFMSEIKEEANDSIRSQIEETIAELQKEYNNYDEITCPPYKVYYKDTHKINRCIKRQSY